MKASSIAATFLIFLIGSAVLDGGSKAMAESPAVKGTVTSPAVDDSEKPRPYSKNALRRLDFRIVGKSCAVCLLGIKRRVNALDGTVKVAIMLRKPFGASIIYDSTKLNEEKLIATAKANEPLVKLLDVKDEAIPKLPIVLVPPHSNVSDTNTKTNSALLPNE